MPQYTYDQLMALDEQARKGGSPDPDAPTEDPQQQAQQEEGSSSGPLSAFWRGIRAAGRGAAKAVNETSDLASLAGREIVQHTGAYRFLDDEGEAEFLEEADAPIEEVNPFRFNVGERDTGVYGFVESMTQFATGMVGFGKFLKGAKLLKGAGSIRRGAVVGALSDFTVMNTDEGNISTALEGTPFERLAVLAIDEDDSEVVGRLKNTAEGLITGIALDYAVAGLRAKRVARQVEAGKMTPEEGDKAIAEIYEGVEEAATKSDEPVVVEHHPGKPSVIKVRQENLFDDDTMEILTEEGVPLRDLKAEVSDPARAESLAAGMNMSLKRAKLPTTELTDDQKTAVREATARLNAGEAEEEVLRGLAPQLNLASIQTEDEVKAWIKSFSNFAQEEAVALANRASDGGGVPWSQTMREGREFATGVSHTDMVRNLSEIYGETEDLHAKVFGAKLWVASRASRIQEISTKLEKVADPALLEAELDKELDSLWAGFSLLAGTKANIARSMNAMKIGATGDLPRPKIHDDVVENPPKRPSEARTDEREGIGVKKPLPEGHEDLTRSGKSNLRGNAQHIRKIVEPSDKLSKVLTKSQRRALARAMIMNGGDPRRTLDALRITRWVNEDPEDPTRWARANAFRANLMLSGPKTHAVNAISNFLVGLQVPAEYWWAGKRTGNEALAQQGADILKNNFLFLLDSAQATMKALAFRDGEHLTDGIQAVRQTWQQGNNVLDPKQLLLEHRNYASPPAAGRSWLQSLVSAPSRALMASDEFFKQMNYRSHVASQSLRLAREQGVTDPKRVAERLAEDLYMAFDIEGGATNVNALSHARYATFTNELGEDSMAGRFQHAIYNSDFLQTVLPFYRTPVNIFRFAWDRTPVLWRLSQRMKEDIAAGGERAAIAQAKVDAGKAMYGMAALLAANGMITGNGPSDPGLRQTWLQANQPYSIRLPNGKFVEYRRLEPLATPLAFVADAVQLMGDLDQKDAEKLVAAGLAGITSMVSSKTFMLGLSQFFDAVASGEEYSMARWIEDTTLSYVIPNAVRQMNPDPVWRESRSILEEAQSRVPGFSSSLEPRRNLFGEPVLKPPHYLNRSMNPFTTMTPPEDSWMAEQLVELGKRLPMPRETMEEGRVDLTDRGTYDNGTGQSPYDRMLELVADPPGNRPPLRDAMKTLMESPAWKEASPGNEIYQGGARHKMAEKLVENYYKAARAQMLTEYPKLRESIYEDRRGKARSILGVLEEASRQ